LLLQRSIWILYPTNRPGSFTRFAFVYYRNARDADDAVRGLDGREFGYKRRRLRVEWSKGDGDIKKREDTRRRNIKPTTTLFVVNFNVEETRERDLERLFEKFGRLIRVQIKRTYAFIQYEEVDQAEAAMKETHLSRFMGRTISVEYVCKDPDERREAPAARSPPRGGRDRYRSRSRSPYRRPRSRSPSYGRGSPRRSLSRSLTPRRSPARSLSRSPVRSRDASMKRSPSRSYSRSPSR